MTEECPTGKRQYNTEEKAHKFRRYTALGNIKKGIIGRDDRALNVYKCRRCNLWHVGHSMVGESSD